MNTQAKQSEFSQISDSKNLSQLIRSNAPEYWAYVKRSADLRALKPYLEFEGAVAGDPHLGNFGPMPVMTNEGTRKMRFVNIDFDDAGHAPFVLDYVRYVAAIKAQCEPMKSAVLQKNYLLGLAGKTIPPRKKVAKFLRMKISEYDGKAAKYCQKHCLEDGFKFKAGAIDQYKGTIRAGALGKIFPGEQVLCLAKRVETRGGSSDEVRIWALVAASQSKRRIMELKQYAAPGTGKYQRQPPVKQWLSEIRQAFWPGLTGADYNLVDIEGGGRFWIREKRVPLINVPYSSKKPRDVEFVMDLARYDANLLGLAHGRQALGPAYHAAIRRDPAAFHQATKQVAHAYLEAARKAFKEKAAPRKSGR